MTTGESETDTIPVTASTTAPPPLVTIATISGGAPRLEFLNSIFALRDRNLPWIGNFVLIPSGPYLDDGRNELIAKVLETTDTPYVLIVDDDIGFTPENVYDIIGQARALRSPCIISGAYRNGDKIIAGWKDPATQFQEMMDIETFRTMAALPTSLFRVDGAGCGFMLVSREIFTTMRDLSGMVTAAEGFGDICPWFREPIIGGIHMGEDYGFCDRASYLGYPIYLMPSVRLVHVKVTAQVI